MCEHRGVTMTAVGHDGKAPLLDVLPRVHRHPTDRVVAGVAGGLAEELAVDPMLVRGAFLVLSLAGGAGILLYLLAWAVATEERTAPTALRPTAQRAAALGLVVLGLLVAFRSIGLWFGDALVWPLALAALGSAVIWTRSAEADRPAGARPAGSPLEALFAGGAPLVRLLAGGLLAVVGMVAFLAANESFAALGHLAVAVAVALVGLGLLLGPWVWRLGHQLADERRERIRSQERAEVAAHLHDSVLQTLALIQRADVSPDVASLARGQERELRAWLYGRAEEREAGSVRSAVEELAARVEAAHRVPVDAVVVGDAPLDDRLRALVAACAEAATNAAVHSGATLVSVYVEVEPGAVSAFVRDEGRGFDPAAVPGDRRGIAESIHGRMTRHGGSAHVMSTPGAGTEVELVMALGEGNGA